MRIVHFSYSEANKKPINGTITIHPGDKIAVSISNARSCSAVGRYKAQLLANEIIHANFEHTAVNNVIEKDVSLLPMLRGHTKELRSRFLKRSREYARKYFKHAQEMLNQPLEKWCIEYGVYYQVTENHDNQKIVSIKDFGYAYRRMKKKMDVLEKVTSEGLRKLEDKEVRRAESHYTSSIVKLAIRLSNKGITPESTLRISHADIGINLHLTIEHNGKIIKAWTIIAEGLIQRPHYRFLVR